MEQIRPTVRPFQPHKPAKGLKRSTATLLMMIGLLLSKITGQLREILIVPTFGGLGVGTDAFIIGFQIPDLFYQLLVGGAIQAAITPTLAAAIENKSEKKGWRSISIFINCAAIVMLAAVLIGEIMAPFLIELYNPDKNPQTVALAIRVTRALFPQVFFMMLAALCIGILNAYKKFASTSFGPSIYNMGVVLAMLILGNATANGPVRVAFGVMLAAFFYFVIQFYLARNEFKHYRWLFDFKDRGFRQLIKLAIPTLISGSIIQLNSIILTGFANQFDGAATALRQATTTWQLPYGVVVVAIGNVMLPSLAAANAARDRRQARKLYTESLRTALFIIFPAAAIFLAMQLDTIRAIFQWSGHYSDQNVAAIGSVLSWFCLAMVAQTVVFITNHAFYAKKITQIALFNGLLSLLLNWILCRVLTNIPALGISALSLAYTITSTVSALVLYLLYKNMFKQSTQKRIWPYLVSLSLSTAALLLVILLLNQLSVAPAGKLGHLLWYFGRALIGAVSYFAMALWLRLPEAKVVLAKLKHLAGRFFK